MQQLPPALAALASYPKFIVYQLLPKPGSPGKTLKLPCNRSGHTSGLLDPLNWSGPDAAIADAQRLGATYGVGYVFTQDDPFWFLDIDGAVTSDNTWSPVAQQLLEVFAGCAVEVSSSGRGLHIIGTGEVPTHGCKNIARGLELYTQDRFVALTGTQAQGSAGHAPNAVVLDWLVSSYFAGTASTGAGSEWTDGPVANWRGPVDDDDLIRRALASKSARAAFGGGASFADLWDMNVEVLSRVYPDPEGNRAFDGSSADAALFAHLSFWTGKDCERMRTIAMRSGLVRDKWEREDYLQRTILGACARSTDVMQDKPVEVPAVELAEAGTYAAAAMTPRGGTSFLNAQGQAALFAGCVWISRINQVLIPGGEIVDAKRFDVRYGGRTFTLDSMNERTTRSAYEAFTQHQDQAPTQVVKTVFRPQFPPGAVIQEPGQRVVNTYWPIDVPTKDGDPSRFFDFLERILPVERDRKILLAYMASLVQNKGIKFQWAVLVQGVPGNGKTLLSRVLAHAIGSLYTAWPNADGLDSEFNGWLERTIFAAIEEIRVVEHQAKMIERLKIMITGGHGLQIQRKGVDQDTKDVCANFLFTTNYKSALPLDENDRRFCVFYTKQQHVSDLVRDKMDKSTRYFPDLYEWLDAEGYAIMAKWLMECEIPAEFDPARGCQRAPDTSSTREVISESAGRVEQEIQEAIDQEAIGFKGGYVSSHFLNTLLTSLRLPLTYTKRREILRKLGFIPHPGLVDGRLTASVAPDGSKSRLFVREGSTLTTMTGAREIAAHYSATQVFIDSPGVTMPPGANLRH
jgi:hypothetical protein